jgi:hypothetical protein
MVRLQLKPLGMEEELMEEGLYISTLVSAR